MDLNEVIISYFGNSTTEIYKNNLTNIRKYISSKKDHVSIDIYDISLDDIVKKSKDDSYLNGQELIYTDGGIKLLFPVKNLWNDIKYYIPKSITKLEIPFEIIQNDISFLKNFPNLETLALSDYVRLNKEQIQKIQSNTNIKRLLVNYTSSYVDFYKNEGFAIEDGNVLYKNLLIQKKDSEEKDFKLDTMYIDTYNLNREQIEKLYSISEKKDKIIIRTQDSSRYTINFLNGKLIDVSIDSNDLIDVTRFYSYLVNNGCQVNSVCINVEKIDYLNMDLSRYEKLAKETNLTFDYGVGGDPAKLEEFKGLVASLNWYRNLIKEANLSPTEKVMFAYDIMKTFSYNESNSSKNDSRAPHRIIETGNIVCAGYANTLKQILKGMDNIKVGDITVDCFDSDGNHLGGHARNIVELDDSKYNIHGIYVLDATWDSYQKGLRGVKKYTALDLYRYFLVAPNDYKLLFPNDTVPDIFMSKEKKVNLVNEYCYAFEGISVSIEDSKLINTVTEDKVQKDLDARRISLDTFNQMLYNVRLAEGYTQEMMMDEIRKVDKMNLFFMLEKNKENGTENISYFEEYEDKGKKKAG